MDRFYSITNIEQLIASDQEEDCAVGLRVILPSLSLYSRHTCARAIISGVSEIHTLFLELLQTEVQAHMSDQHRIQIIKPISLFEESYLDALLEERYQNALATFRTFNVNPMQALADKRSLDF